MDTKNKIVHAAVELFNQKGISNVTVRQIAAEVDISPGNLAYHYKTRDVLVHEIYRRMDEEMVQTIHPQGELSLEHFHYLLERITGFQQKYRFFYLDMPEIARRYPRLIQQYRQAETSRNRQFIQLVKIFIAKGLLKREPQQGYYQSLFRTIGTVLTFRLQQELIMGENSSAPSPESLVQIWEILLPYLTDEGLREYRSFACRDRDPQEPLSPIQQFYLSDSASSFRQNLPRGTWGDDEFSESI